MDRATLYLDCKDCNMHFESLEALKTHQARFCKTSDYGDYTKLQKILNHSTKEKQEIPLNLDRAINQTTQFLNQHSKNQSNSSLSLASLSQDINKKQQELKSAASKIVNREDALRLELENLTKGLKGDESELLNIMTEIHEKRESEIKAIKEKELVTRALKDLDKRNLNALEYQKKMQMKALAEEREALRKKEDDLFNEVKRMQARLMDEEQKVKVEKEKIGSNLVTIKESDNELAEKRIEELSNIRGKEVLAIKESRANFEMEKERIENELRLLQKGDARRNHAGIQAANSIMTPLQPLDLQDRRNLPTEVLTNQQRWLEDYDRLNEMKKAHDDYVKNEPGYDIKGLPPSTKPKFVEEVSGLVKDYHSSLNPGQRARVLDYIKEDMEVNYPLLSENKPQNPPKSELTQNPKPQVYNTAKYKLSSESTAEKPMVGGDQVNIYSPHIYEKYKQEASDKFLNEYKLPPNEAFKASSPEGKYHHPYQGGNSFRQAEDPRSNSQQRFQTNNPYQQPYNPYIDPFQNNPNQPYPYQGQYNPYATPPANPETEKLKKKLDKLKELVKSSKSSNFNPKQLQNALSEPYDYFTDPNLLPEEKLLSDIANQNREDLRLLSMLPHDSEIYQAKLSHFKEMSAARARMEASLQDLALQRMKYNMEREESMYDKQLAEEMWQEDQRRLQALSKVAPAKVISNKDYNPSKGLFIGWDILTGIPQKYKKSQVAYGVYERGAVRLEPHLVLPVPTQEDPMNPLALKSEFRDTQDLKRLPALPHIVSILEIQGTDVYNNTSVIGWTLLELFTASNSVYQGYWKIPIYRPPTKVTTQASEISNQIPLPNSFIYLRIYGAENSANFPTAKSLSQYRIPPIHNIKDQPLSRPQSLRNAPPDPKPASRHTPHSILHKSSQSSAGIHIKLESLIGFKSRAHLKFRITFQRSGQTCIDDRGGFCIWNSDPISTQNADVSINNSRVSSKEGWDSKEVSINKQTHFLKNFFRYQDEIDWSDDLIMIVEVLERNPRKLSAIDGGLSSPVDDYFLIAWTLFVISDSSQKLMNYCTTELSLFKPPIPGDLSEIERTEQVSGLIKLTVQELGKEPREAVKSSANNEPFLENMNPQYDDGKIFKKGDGVDVYVDGARFLPDNATCTKIVIKSFTNKLESIGNAIAGLAELTSPAFSPSYGFRTEFRTPTFNPTTLLVISIITIDAAHKEVRLLGYSAINLFVHKYRKGQPTSESEEDIILNSGAFQLPIYCQEPYRKEPFTLNSFTGLEIIPCATLLVRIRDAPKAQQGVRILSVKDVPASEWYIRGLIVPPPKYEQRVYNTSYCMPTPIEREIYAERAVRKSPTVFEATLEMMEALGFRLDLTENEMQTWISETLNINPSTPIIDLKYFAKYSTKLGFKVSIDAIHKFSGNRPIVVLFTLNPPASFYSQSVISQDIQIADQFNWDSALGTPQYLDGFHSFRNVKFNQNLHVLIDVRAVNIEKKSLEPVGWTALPVFYQDGYVKSGIFQLPLFAGAVPIGLLPEMANHQPYEYLMQATKTSGGPKFLEPVSVLLRIVDCQREGHFNVPLDLNRMNYDYIPKELLGKFSYNSAAFQRNLDRNTLRKTVPINTTPVSYGKLIHEIVVEALNVQHL